MARNILIFSDGTGQVGGYEFDEDRTNVYKLYRATRVGPNSCIDPHEQAAFYDPGLGSRGQGGFPLGRLVRWIYRKVSQATGLGITRNITDCYAAIIRFAKPDDRIFFLGSAAEAVVSPERVRLVIVRNHRRSEDHMVVAVYDEDAWFILDNATMIAATDTEHATHYTSLFVPDKSGVRRY